MRQTTLSRTGKRRKRSPGPQARNLRLESLEPRTLLSAATLSVSRGVAKFTDTEVGPDSVIVSRLPDGSYDFLADNAIHYRTNVGQVVKRIEIREYAGDDTAVIDPSVGTIPVKFWGGAGNDSAIQNADGIFTAYGQDGDDSLVGGDANDYLDGGNGCDRLEGGNGNDRLLGQRGNDNLLGGAGNDRLEGGNDQDCLEGGDGNDTLLAGNGEDVLFGGRGRDTYNGGCHYVDTLYVTRGEDVIKMENDRRTPDNIIWGDPTALTTPWTVTNGTLTVDWSTQSSGANVCATGPTTVDITWNASTWTITGVQSFVFVGGPYGDTVNMALLAGTSTVTGNGGADVVNFANGHFGDRFGDYTPGQGDTLVGDMTGGSVTTADEQYGITSWLLRGTTVDVVYSSYFDPLGRVPANVSIAGADVGLHLFASDLRVEVPSISSFTIDTLTRNALLGAGFQIDVVVVGGGSVLDPLNC